MRSILYALYFSDVGEFRYAGCSHIDRVAQQDQSYFEIRDNLRNARRKKDGKPEIKTTTMRKSTTTGAKSSSSSDLPAPMTRKALNPKQAIAGTAPPAPPVNDENSNNNNNNAADRASTGSDGTIYTSKTEVIERASTLTAVVNSNVESV